VSNPLIRTGKKNPKNWAKVEISDFKNQLSEDYEANSSMFLDGMQYT
jgi:hypothetical protein